MGSEESEDSDDSAVDTHERVLAPDDLDITKRPEVEEIDDGRYVVSPNGPAKKPDRELLENPDWLDNEADDETDETTETAPQRRSRQPTSSEPSRSGQQRPGQPTPNQNAESAQSAPTQQPPNQSASQPADAQQPAESQQPPTQSQSSGSQPTSSPPDESTPASGSQSASGRADQPTSPELAAHDQPPAEPPAVELTNENVSKFLAKSLAKTSGDYGFDATVNIEGNVNRGRMTSDDIGETLETLLRWYARQTTDEVEPEHVLGIILAGSDLAVEYPVQSAYEVVKQHGLGPDDTISDLLAAVREEGSFTVPPSSE